MSGHLATPTIALTVLTPPPAYAELVALPQWVNAERDKVPYTPSLTGPKERAKAGNRATFGTCPVALEAQATGRFPLVGLELLEDDPYFLIDLDQQRDRATEQPTPLARGIIALAN